LEGFNKPKEIIMAQAKPKNSCIWFEIPVTDLDAGKKFYGTVLNIGFNDMTDGPNPIAIFDIEDTENNPAGHLYPGKPCADGSGATVHLHAHEGLEKTIDRVAPAGGVVLTPPIAIPAGRFVYCQDPDGNSFALFGA